MLNSADFGHPPSLLLQSAFHSFAFSGAKENRRPQFLGTSATLGGGGFAFFSLF